MSIETSIDRLAAALEQIAVALTRAAPAPAFETAAPAPAAPAPEAAVTEAAVTEAQAPAPARRRRATSPVPVTPEPPARLNGSVHAAAAPALVEDPIPAPEEPEEEDFAALLASLNG